HLTTFSSFSTDPATSQLYTLSIHDALPIWSRSSDHRAGGLGRRGRDARGRPDRRAGPGPAHHRSARLAVGGDLSDHLQRLGEPRSGEHTSELQSPYDLVCRLLLEKKKTKKI